jgi:hypothetical protein
MSLDDKCALVVVPSYCRSERALVMARLIGVKLLAVAMNNAHASELGLFCRFGVVPLLLLLFIW